MPVDNGKNNQHRWWGTLTIDPNMADSDGLAEGTQCVFIKTKKDSHFVNSGTRISKVKQIKSTTDLNNRIDKLPGLTLNDIQRIKEDLSSIESQFSTYPKVEITELDLVNTSPLTLRMNQLTEELLTSTSWLAKNEGWSKYGDTIGKENILITHKLQE